MLNEAYSLFQALSSSLSYLKYFLQNELEPTPFLNNECEFCLPEEITNPDAVSQPCSPATSTEDGPSMLLLSYISDAIAHMQAFSAPQLYDMIKGNLRSNLRSFLNRQLRNG